MAYFEPYIDADGLHIPTYADRMERLISEYKRIFSIDGEDIYIGPETPDYQLLSVFAKALDDENALIADVYNARNPFYARGNSLDLLLPLIGMARKQESKSTVELTLTGATGVLIPKGTRAIDEAGNTWATIDSLVFDDSGTGVVPAECETGGAIAAAAGTINGMYTPIIGWEGVTNAQAAVVGEDAETDDDVRRRLTLTYSKKNNGTINAVVSRLFGLDDVEYAVIFENDTNETDSRGIPGHSICVVVQGGDNAEIAEVIYLCKSPGCGTYGNTAETVMDLTGEMTTIHFSRPTQKLVDVFITIRMQAGHDPDTIKAAVKQAIDQDISGLEIGASWVVTSGYKDVYTAFETSNIPVAIISVTASAEGQPETPYEIICNYDEMLRTGNVTVTIQVG